MIVNYLKRMGWYRCLIVILGTAVLGMGVGLLQTSNLGMDPFDGMNVGVSAHLPIAYAQYQLIFNICVFIIEILFGRNLIGFGTIVNAVGLGYFVTFFHYVFSALLPDPSLPVRVIILCIGVLLSALGLSLYQIPNTGVAPYDALSLILDRRVKKIPYFAFRVLFDGISALVCLISGGPFGLGTFLMAFCLGPFISFFNENFTKKIVTPME